MVKLASKIQDRSNYDSIVQFEDKGVVLSGEENQARGENAVVAGGSQNAANAINATVSGGMMNAAITSYATVAGGRENEASNFLLRFVEDTPTQPTLATHLLVVEAEILPVELDQQLEVASKIRQLPLKVPS